MYIALPMHIAWIHTLHYMHACMYTCIHAFMHASIRITALILLQNKALGV